MSGILLAASLPGQVELLPDALAASDFTFSPNDALAWLQFRNNGSVYDQDNSYVGDWINPTSAANGGTGWYIRANSASPDTPDIGTMDTWLQLTSSRTWQQEELGFGIDTAIFTVDIRYGTSGGALATRTVTLTAQVDF